MIQPISSTRAAQATAVLTRPESLNTQRLETAQLQTRDTLQLQKNTLTDAEILDILKGVRAKYGSLRRPRIFDSKKISDQEALQRLKEGDKVFVKNGQVKDIRDTFKDINDLLIFDDLQGNQKDHGVIKPEHRLPLIFLQGQKLEPYRNDDGELLDLYNAYQSHIRKDWRIQINGKTVKPEDLASHVVNSGLTASKDPGLKTLSRFQKLPDNGWTVNGQSVNRDTAYMAFITGSSAITFQGAAVKNAQDFALLMNLVGNEDNGALDKTTRARLLNYNLRSFSSPGIQNHFNVYQHLKNGQALSYAGSVIHSLTEMEIYDALEGTKQPTSKLDAKLYDALMYLGQDGGLNTRNAYRAWQALAENQAVSYAFPGGPTGETITLSAYSHEELIALKAKVVNQRQRDQYRPELGDAKNILKSRLPQFDAPLADNLARTRAAAARARQDLPIQEQNRDRAERDYHEIKPVHDRAYEDFKDAERVADRAERDYNSDKRNYDWVKRDYDNIQRDFDRAQRDYQNLVASARRYEQQAQAADRKASTDPDNAAKHRQDAANLRGKARNAQTQADRRYNDMQRHRTELDRKRWDVDRARREMDRSRDRFWNARQTKDYKKTEWQHQASRLNEAKGRLETAERNIQMARKTINEAQTIENLTSQAQQALGQLKTLSAGLASYSDYQNKRDQIQGAAAQIKTVLNNSTYTSVHGRSLASQWGPLATLLANMNKPAQ